MELLIKTNVHGTVLRLERKKEKVVVKCHCTCIVIDCALFLINMEIMHSVEFVIYFQCLQACI